MCLDSMKTLGAWMDLEKKCSLLGLNPHSVLLHQKRIKEALTGGVVPMIPIEDTCRLDNGGLIPIDSLMSAGHKADGYVALVPAAGAASRYLSVFSELVSSCKSGDLDKLKEASFQFKERYPNWGSWLTSAPIRRVVAVQDHSALSQQQLHDFIDAVELPKALMPCSVDGATFIEVKSFEHARIPGVVGQAFVVAPQFEKAINGFIEESSAFKLLPSMTLVQGSYLSTLRFDSEGEAILRDNELSPVPAGHGTLTELFSEAGSSFDHCHSLFIRNVDNVSGGNPESRLVAEKLLSFHQELLSLVASVRRLLAKKDEPADCVTKIASLLNVELGPCAPILENLTKIQINGFHTPPLLLEPDDNETAWDRLVSLYNRPLNILGQVPNLGCDVGGTAVFTKGPYGTEVICLEIPHASEEDVDNFLKRSEKATHFNPVFCCAEIPEDALYYKNYEADVPWLLAKKQFMGERVYYHETVLYELIGSSRISNVVFVEVPRSVFNPHKSIVDCVGLTLKELMEP